MSLKKIQIGLTKQELSLYLQGAWQQLKGNLCSVYLVYYLIQKNNTPLKSMVSENKYSSYVKHTKQDIFYILKLKRRWISLCGSEDILKDLQWSFKLTILCIFAILNSKEILWKELDMFYHLINKWQMTQKWKLQNSYL